MPELHRRNLPRLDYPARPISPGGPILSEFYHLRRTTIKDVAAYCGFLLGFIGAAPIAWQRLTPDLQSESFVTGLWYFFSIIAAAGVGGGIFGLVAGTAIGSLWERYHRYRRGGRAASLDLDPADEPITKGVPDDSGRRHLRLIPGDGGPSPINEPEIEPGADG